MEKDKAYYIKFFRERGFNCFPIPVYPESDPEPKRADHRYAASRTIQNQEIKPDENYGIIPLKNSGNIILDLDHKELYRKFAEINIEQGYMVIETPNGWHIPVTGLTGDIKKMMFYNTNVEPNKQIVEIQSYDHYVVGAGCKIWNTKKNQIDQYINRGTENIWSAKGSDIEKFIDAVCKHLDVKPKEYTKSANYNQRERFREGKIPTKGTSNNYFFNAAMVCKTEGDTKDEAEIKIKQIYDQWAVSDDFSGRTWENVQAKIDDVYANDDIIKTGRPEKKKENDLIKFCQDMIADRQIYSDEETNEIFENKKGYLENVTNKLHKEIQQKYPEMTKEVLNDIKFRLVGLAPDLPETNKHLKVFDNGVYDETQKQIIDTDDIASMGFKGYNYLPPSPDNEPKEFMRIIFSNVPQEEHKRVKAGLKSAITPKLDPRISVIHGKAGVGKSLSMEILFKVLNRYEEYALTLELDQLLNDSFIKAKIKNKTLMVLTDLPEVYKDFSKLKAITGEGAKTERAFYSDATTFENKLKIFATTNYLAKIPTKEKNAMYRRISLIHNIREVPYDVNPDLADIIVKNEGEKIISWILNIPESECEYESPNQVKKEWEGLASPEIEYMETFWQIVDTSQEVSVMLLRKDFEEKYQTSMTHQQFTEALKDQGYYISRNMVSNIIPVPQKDESQKRL